MNIQHILQIALQKASGLSEVYLEHPADLSHGDFATSIALQLAGRKKQQPREVAEELKSLLEKDETLKSVIASIEIAGPGFINFRLQPTFFADVF